MKNSLLCSGANVKDYANLASKFWQFSLILLFLFLNSLSAQEVPIQQQASSGLIIMSGDAVIYSKDASFNEQISKSEAIQQYSKIVKISDNELKIVAKNFDKPTKKQQPKIKKEVDLLAAKKLKESKKVNVPQKKIDCHFSDGYRDSHFLTGMGSLRGSFFPPSNDYQYSKYVVGSNNQLANTSLYFLYSTTHFSNDNSSIVQASISTYTVRPPPDLV